MFLCAFLRRSHPSAPIPAPTQSPPPVGVAGFIPGFRPRATAAPGEDGVQPSSYLGVGQMLFPPTPGPRILPGHERGQGRGANKQIFFPSSFFSPQRGVLLCEAMAEPSGGPIVGFRSLKPIYENPGVPQGIAYSSTSARSIRLRTPFCPFESRSILPPPCQKKPVSQFLTPWWWEGGSPDLPPPQGDGLTPSTPPSTLPPIAPRPPILRPRP